jgi:MbtH protein
MALLLLLPDAIQHHCVRARCAWPLANDRSRSFGPAGYCRPLVSRPMERGKEDDMSFAQPEAGELFRVVANHEEQYSIWPADRPLPPGWRDMGQTGSKDECLTHIEKVWTDMRPLSLRTAAG